MSVVSFRGLFAQEGSVIIPMIQRDYAQGREDARSQEILRRFLEDLRASLERGEEPLDLDFVYGRWRAEGKVLEPLDGQQRLTTLFLLHWYFAQHDGQQEDFWSWIRRGERCRFSYHTRPSAEEFMDKLAGERLDLATLPTRPDALAAWLQDRPWFLRTWLRDPTVVGCLRALDQIHAQCKGLSGGYARLTDTAAPPVTFHLLRMGDFHLSDDLYIKMNARGKPLTGFEIFKAELQRYVDESFGRERHKSGESWSQHLRHRMDGAWTDFLWHHRDESNQIDARFVQLVRAAAVIHVARGLCAESDLEEIGGRLEALLKEENPGFDSYARLAPPTSDFVKTLVELLDTLAQAPEGRLGFLARGEFFDEGSALEGLLAPSGASPYGPTLAEWVKLVAYGLFLLTRGGGLGTEDSRVACHDWMRVVCNLVENPGVMSIERFMVSLVALSRVHQVGARDGFLEEVAKEPELWRGFGGDQRTEERLKAQLILKDEAWRGVLERAEAHSYFRGDAQFLLWASHVWNIWEESAQECSWPTEIDQKLRDSFASWHKRLCAIFPEEERGLSEDLAGSPYLWQRALLVEGDYLLRWKPNMSLLDNLTPEANWKRLLRADTRTEGREERRDVVRRVLEQIDPDKPQESLKEMVGGASLETLPMWRRVLVENHRILGECHKRMLRFVGHTVYLLSKRKLTGYYVDLFAYALYAHFNLHKEQGCFKGFKVEKSPWIKGSSTASMMRLKHKGASLEVTTQRLQSHFRVLGAKDQHTRAFEGAGWTYQEGVWSCTVALERGRDVLDQAAHILSQG